MINKSIAEGMSKLQLEALSEIRQSVNWGVISKLVKEIIDKDCDLDIVSDDLSCEEYKIECLARKKAKRMFTQIFDDVNDASVLIEKKKIDYS